MQKKNNLLAYASVTIISIFFLCCKKNKDVAPPTPTPVEPIGAWDSKVHVIDSSQLILEADSALLYTVMQ